MPSRTCWQILLAHGEALVAPEGAHIGDLRRDLDSAIAHDHVEARENLTLAGTTEQEDRDRLIPLYSLADNGWGRCADRNPGAPRVRPAQRALRRSAEV